MTIIERIEMVLKEHTQKINYGFGEMGFIPEYEYDSLAIAIANELKLLPLTEAKEPL